MELAFCLRVEEGGFGAQVGESDEGREDGGPRGSLVLPGVRGPGRPEGSCARVCRPGWVSQRVTAGGGRARLGVARPLPHRLQLSGPRRLKEHPRRPVAAGRRRDSGVCPRPAARGSASAGGRHRRPCPRGGRAGGSPFPAQAGARLSSPRPPPPPHPTPGPVRELTLGCRLGSLTQIRHDKEGDAGTRAEAPAWAEPRRGVAAGADGRVCPLKSQAARCRFTHLEVFRR